METLTLSHALSKNSIKELQHLYDEYLNEEEIDPNVGKKELIDELLPVIPQSDHDRIIDNTFSKPKTRYTAHLGYYEINLPEVSEIELNCDQYNDSHGYDLSLKHYQTNRKEIVKLVDVTNDQMIFYFTESTRKLEFDEDAMESKPIVYTKRIRIILSLIKKRVSVFTGNKDLFNQALIALTVILKGPIKPLEMNQTGIRETVRGSFSFHTVKALDFVYHGLSQVGMIGAINQIDLETPSKSKKPQKVKVQGDELLDDKSICDYLFYHSRDLVGFKLDFTFKIREDSFKTNIVIGLRDNKVKIGVKKDNYSLDKVKEFFTILEDNAQTLLMDYGLIDENKTIKILEKIRSRAIEQG
jgi:hypothetical protein